MILDALTLHDFGIYGGRQSVELTPASAERPIVLFGGLNGGGKTTFVDALQLCLYGQAARCSNRGVLAYDDFLRRSVHRRASEPGAALALDFRHTSDGRERRFRIERSWTARATCRERFEVHRDGRFDALATEHWAEQVEDFIPARIAHLFLFDGEKVEGYADLAEAPLLVATAIHGLLGLDLVERLAADLTVLERRVRAEGRPQGSPRVAEELRVRIAALADERRAIAGERAATVNALDRAEAALAAAEERFRRDGGALFEANAALEVQAETRRSDEAAALAGLRVAAAGDAPLLLVAGLLESARVRDAAAEGARLANGSIETLAEEHEAVMALAESVAVPVKARRALRAALEARLRSRREAASGLDATPRSPECRALLSHFDVGGLARLRAGLADSVAAARSAVESSVEARTALAAVPAQDAIAAAIAARDEARDRVAALLAERLTKDEALGRLDREIALLGDRERRVAAEEAAARLEGEDVARLLTHSGRARATVARFREAVVARHVGRIERLVLESFRRLVRKGSLVSALRIDPATFAMELRGGDGAPVTPDRLSAGERQLLAVAILWGLAQASGRPLPTVIDTPLGRLDSVHRRHLVERYFPAASHQVLLLSTDEEIAGRHLEALRPSVGRSYRLVFDEAAGRTSIEPGYFASELGDAA